jgi:hypothetical protein
MTKNSSAIRAAVQTFLAVLTSNPSMELPQKTMKPDAANAPGTSEI